MSTMADTLRREIVNAPDYIMPCPACTYLDVEGFQDTIRTPVIVNARGLGVWRLSGPPACALCGPMIRGASVAEVAAAWRERIALAAEDERNAFLHTKTRRCLHRLHRRGLVPADFPMPAE
jgi:hypothetical protein